MRRGGSLGRWMLRSAVVFACVVALGASACSRCDEAPPGGGTVVDIAGSYVAVSAGFHHTCALRADATITCWGPIDELPKFAAMIGPQTDAPPGHFTAVSAGNWHT